MSRHAGKRYISRLCVYVTVIYNLTDCTIISNTVITNNMLLHVSTFKMSSLGSSCLAKISYSPLGLGKIKLLKI